MCISDRDVFPIGKKGNDILSKDFSVAENRGDVFDELTFANVATVADQLMALYTSGGYDRIDLVYNRFKNAATQIVTAEQFLPIVPVAAETASKSDYLYEPAQEEIVSTLIPKALKTQLFKALRDSFASEHGARMTAMHKATDNATELRDQLKLTYNKARKQRLPTKSSKSLAVRRRWMGKRDISFRFPTLQAYETPSLRCHTRFAICV